MRCPFCGTDDTKVIDSRLANDGFTVLEHLGSSVLENQPQEGAQGPEPLHPNRPHQEKGDDESQIG